MASEKAKRKLDVIINKHGLNPANYHQLLKLYSAAIDDKQFDIQTIQKNIFLPWASLNIEGDLVERYKKVHELGKGATFEKFVLIYGEEDGTKRWNEYKNKHKLKNTLEGKRNKYGWTEQEFIEYNKSRAVTLSNLIKKYGEEEGKKKWDEYKNKQRVNGSSLEWFISKYGESTGTLVYNEVCESKGHTLKNYQKRYGIDEGLIKFNEYNTTAKTSFVSKSSKVFFDLLDNRMKEMNNTYSSLSVYFSPKSKEFCKYDTEKHRSYFYDYALPSAKLIVEYNGDLYHANPQKYNENDIPLFRGNTLTAKELWERDLRKREVAKSHGFDVIYVWESDVLVNQEQELERIISEIQRRL
jgi:very-short-patch-repair endonuclease